jgi:Uncharacterized protein SCO1/SenC/PrrC, involved in biogenesis of respiratory and photosynthetic systems
MISAPVVHHTLRVILLLLVVPFCTQRAFSQTSEKVFTVTGVVRLPYSEGSIRIEHDEIPGFMPAMTMPFYADAADASHLKVGDRVQFEFRVGAQSRATNFKKLPSAPSANASAPITPPRPPSARLRPGDLIPDFALTAENDQPLTAAALDGHYTVVTFIFTRCPVPEFCPLMSRKFQELQQTSREQQLGLRLLSITIDPDFDRPDILRAYSKSVDADPAKWRFATGSVEDIAKLTRAFAVRTEFNSGRLDHTLATALIGPDRRIVEIWRGNAWKPSEVLSRLP